MITATEHRAKVAAAMTEGQLLDGILGTPRRPGLALALGWLGYHTHRSEHSPAGFPDLVLVKGGRLIFAELKRQAPRHKPTAEQARWLVKLGDVEADTRADAIKARQDNDPVLRVYLWRPLDLLNGTIEATLRGRHADTGLALPPRSR